MSLGLSGLNLVVSLLLVALGAAACLTLSNTTKRLGALLMMMIGAVLAAASLRLAGGLLVAGITVMLMQCLLGVALVARLQEAYATVELDEIDAFDRADESVERSQ